MHDDLHALIEDMTFGDDAVWRQLAEKALRGADFDEILVRRTADGIARGPVFFDAPETAPATSAPRDLHLPWQIRQVFAEADTGGANKAILADLMGGASEIGLLIDPDGKWGTAIASADDLDTALADVDLSIAPVHIEPASVGDRAELAKKLTDLGADTGGLGLAPDHPDAVPLANDYPGWTVTSVDARCVHESGGSEVQEIAYAAAGLAEIIGQFVEQGESAAAAAGQCEVLLAVDADIHLSICKLRAARVVLGQIAKAYDVDAAVRLRAITSARMMTRKDPWTNLIRLSAAGFAGAVGGADVMTVLPATLALGRPDRLARRVARNLHILLQEESHTGVVNDAAAGSYLHETLTAELARNAWNTFQQIEADGGFSAMSPGSGFVSGVAAAGRELLDSYAKGARALIGVSRYAAPDLRDMRFAPGEAAPQSDARFKPVRLEDACETGGAA